MVDKNQNKHAFIMALTVVSALISATSLADDIPGKSLFDLSLKEILQLRVSVTSQKREEPLQEVPNAVSLVNGKQITNNSLYSIENIAAVVPVLSFRKAGTQLNSSLFLRGIGTINFSIAAEPSVALVQDGVVMSRSGETFNDLFDVDRIEVLSGPQGTLFGKNASAGLINIVSKMPGDKPVSEIESLYTDDGEYRINGSVDLPLTDNLLSRFAIYSAAYDGAINNLYNDDDINGYDHYGMRGIFRWNTTDDLRFTFIADKRNADDDCCVQVIGRRAISGPDPESFDKLFSGIDIDGDKTRDARNNLTQKTKDQAWGISLQADISLDDFTLTSITSSRRWNNHEIRERDLLDVPAAYIGNDFAQVHENGPQKTSTFSQELRLMSPKDDDFDYVAGLYFYRNEGDRQFERKDIVCTASSLPVDETGLSPCSNDFSTFIYPDATARFGADGKNYSAFAQGNLSIIENVRAVLGMRYTKDSLSYYHRRIGAEYEAPGLRTDDTNYAGDSDNTNWSGKAGLEWQLTPDYMSYVTYTRGYKGPAYNVSFNMAAISQELIDEETVDAYEAGFKSTLWDGKAIANIAAYHALYDNFQANFSQRVGTLNVTRLTNAGKVSTQGMELSLIVTPVEYLDISASAAYTDAQIEAFNASGSPEDDRSGERLPYAPEWKTSVMIDYRYVLVDFPVDLAINGTFIYSGEQYAALGANENMEMNDYSRLDFSAGIIDKKDRYSLSLFIKNITDESYSSLIESDGPGGSHSYMIPRDADRYIGLRFGMRFGDN